MKYHMLTLAMAASLAFAANASAEPNKDNDNARGHRDRPSKKELMEKFDKDGDGKLSDEEKAAMKAAREERHKKILAEFDKDGDGKLNDEERAAAKEAHKNREGGGDKKAAE